MSEVPPGFRLTELADPFEIFIGPVFEQGEGLGRRYALRLDERHRNMGGNAHGGVLMTFADLTLGQIVWEATARAAVVTMNMQTQFLTAAKSGDLLEVTPEITKMTRSLIFARGDYRVGDSLIFTAQSVWKLLGRD